VSILNLCDIHLHLMSDMCSCDLVTDVCVSILLDTPGTTVLTYTPDGKRVITAGSDSAIRIYTVGQDGEPITVDEGVEGHFGIAATARTFFIKACCY
jgi:WD40 repeat protein